MLPHPSWGVAGGGEASELHWYENDVTRPPFVIPASAGIQGEEWVPPIVIPWCAGGRRHERLVRKRIPDSDPG